MADYVHDAQVDSRPPRPPHPTCIETTGHGGLVAGIRSWVCGRDCPRPAGPDPVRDARVDAYRDRERRRAARALDRLLELRADDVDIATGGAARVVAGERFVELVGDYVLARLGERFDSSGDPMCEQTGCQGGWHVAPCVYADTECD